LDMELCIVGEAPDTNAKSFMKVVEERATNRPTFSTRGAEPMLKSSRYIRMHSLMFFHLFMKDSGSLRSRRCFVDAP